MMDEYAVEMTLLQVASQKVKMLAWHTLYTSSLSTTIISCRNINIEESITVSEKKSKG